MFAREITLTLKADSKSGFTAAMENDVLPILRKQSGFRDGITFFSQDGSEGVGISLWDNKESADAYEKASYAQVASTLKDLSTGEPDVKSFEVSNSTWHKIAAK
jgi:heme-degrading monooxygenase HmoA